MNGETDNAQPTIQSLWCASKPRSPLCDNSCSVIQAEIVPEELTLKTETSKQGKGLCTGSPLHNSVRKDQVNGQVGVTRQGKVATCLVLGWRETTTLQDREKDPKSHHNSGPESDRGVTKSKPERGTSRKVTVKKTESKAAENRKVTDYYPVRRSSRKSKAELKNEEHQHLDDLIKNGVEEGIQVKHTEGKGRGVFAVRPFQKGQYVIEYHGDLLHLAEAKKREALYAQDPGTGCYMYYFQYLSKTYCVDATKETTRLGRLLNHSKNGNCQTRLHDIDGIPHLILVASRDIEAEEELLYDYGDRSKESILAHPWLKY
ncbi:lysine methyltransferase 5Ab isoform X2 [Esox lucius]|nr:lysine methyltransferase 5Ab isoform X2 [Esox lucius]